MLFLRIRNTPCLKGSGVRLFFCLLMFLLAGFWTLSGSPGFFSRAEAAGSGVPLPPWGPNDEAGNTNTQGRITYARAALHLLRPDAKSYRLAHLYSDTMPQSPFGTPLTVTHKETQFLPFTSHGANGEEICGGIAEQGTQMDALGHFAHRPLGGEDVFYYNGFTQEEVVGPDGLQRLGIEKYKPIITTFTLLDAVAHNGGVPLEAGEQVTTDDIKAMLRRQHLPALQPGDVLFIYTGWSQKWQDENPNPLFTEYYSKGPGLSPDAALYLEDKVIALVGLDNPFTDAVPDGFLQNGFPPPAGTPPDLPFFIHHHNLTQAGIAQIQNVKLDELIADQVYRGAIFIFPLQIAGGAGSPITPVAVGGPWFF